MAEVKFACPNCGQRLAGDESQGGTTTQCPVCGASVTVPATVLAPRPAESSTPLLGTQHLYPVPAEPDFWSEEEWEEHQAKAAPGQIQIWHPLTGKDAVWFWLFFLLPQFVMLVVLSRGGRSAIRFFEGMSRWVWWLFTQEKPAPLWDNPFCALFVVGAIAAAVVSARRNARTNIGKVALTVVFAPLLLGASLFTSFVATCILAITGAIG